MRVRRKSLSGAQLRNGTSIDVDQRAGRIPIGLELSEPGRRVAERGNGKEPRLFAATGGDDYALLAALGPDLDLATLSLPKGTRISRIGSMTEGEPKLSLSWQGEAVELPETLGFEHSGSSLRGISAPPVGDRL